MKTRIAAVVVLYGMEPAHSVSYQTLLRAEQLAPAGRLELQIFLHNNTPGATPPASLPERVRYADTGNRGLAEAYNRVLSMALAEGYDWLFTLDQDTRLPEETFSRLLDGVEVAERQPWVAAVVPRVVAGGRVVSPHRFAAGAWPRWFAAGYSGVAEDAVFAFNSGALLRVAALRQMGGYSPWFWLDSSDLHTFDRLSRFGKRVYVAGNLEIEHDFSMLNMQERVSPERYRTILLAESAFWDLSRNGLAGLERTARLAVRMGRHLLRHDSSALRRLTWRQLGLRLWRSRRHRIALWRAQTVERLGGEPAASGLPAETRPRVSVCMAAFNGERFVDAQLASIVPQLGALDELVVVDDASRDRTPELLRQWQQKLAADRDAPKMVLVEHARNLGVIRTFEESLRASTGDILFLADDDDLWAPDKVHKVLAVFAAEPRTRLVTTGVALIDTQGHPLTGSDFLKHRRFAPGFWANVWHNQFQGSAMAFRSTLLQHILPFPTGRLFLHDAWIGMRNTLTGGGAVSLAEPLLLYRRHGANLSRKHSRARQIRLRVELLFEHLRRLLLGPRADA